MNIETGHTVGPGWNRASLAEAFATPEAGLDWLRTTDYGTFKRNIAWLNGGLQHSSEIQTGYDDKKAVLTDQVDDELRGQSYRRALYIAADPEAYDSLLGEAFVTAQSMSDPVDASRLLASVIIETQPFGDAHKRLARRLLGLAIRGYDGSIIADMGVRLSDADRNGDTCFSFRSIHELMSSQFSNHVLTERSEADGIPVPNFQELDRLAAAPPTALEEGLPSRVAALYLEQYGFGRVLALAVAQESEAGLEAFRDETGNLSIGRVYESLTPNSFTRLQELDGAVKERFIRSIISGFTGKGPLHTIGVASDVYWPQPIT